MPRTACIMGPTAQERQREHADQNLEHLCSEPARTRNSRQTGFSQVAAWQQHSSTTLVHKKMRRQNYPQQSLRFA